MFKNMTKSEKIKIKLNTDFFKIRKKLKFNYFMIYTGEPDRYFDFKYGKLDWRSLIFKFKILKKIKSKNVFNIIIQTIINILVLLK